jgi:nucleoid DNA-binding protein
MLKKKKISSYAKEISKETGLEEKAVRQILLFGTRNMSRMIAKGEDIEIRNFGLFYFDKKAYAKYIKSKTNK